MASLALSNEASGYSVTAKLATLGENDDEASISFRTTFRNLESERVLVKSAK